MTRVSYHDTVNVLQAMNFAGEGPFARPEWFALLAERKEDVLLAVAEDGDKRVALPLMRKGRMFEPLRNWYSFSWRPLGQDAAVLETLARDLKSQASHIVLSPLPDEDRSACDLQCAFNGAGWFTVLERCDTNHVLRVAGRSFAEYWAGRPGKMRTTLKRKARKVDVRILECFDEQAWADYQAIYADSWKPTEGDPDLLEAFARQEGAAGRIRLGIAVADGQPVAAQFWTVEDGTAYIHKLAHIEAAKPLSAGTTLSAALFEHVIDRDHVELVDFGTGDDPYKRDWMDGERPRYRLECLDPSNPRLWPRILRLALRKLAKRTGRS
ncbi:GNAT family N-acetyltransferase [Erythrobacter sp. HKB08]|uniref:GNAT family N-acetyltransferase n=1 Tax=Erythrobacter sp. HKB08 TaxID=2502843 RepID=UPI001F2D9E8C|nr:GNAT family N-acetyltransferase [Erythrobacter sp. HKB08]